MNNNHKKKDIISHSQDSPSKEAKVRRWQFWVQFRVNCVPEIRVLWKRGKKIEKNFSYEFISIVSVKRQRQQHRMKTNECHTRFIYLYMNKVEAAFAASIVVSNVWFNLTWENPHNLYNTILCVRRLIKTNNNNHHHIRIDLNVEIRKWYTFYPTEWMPNASQFEYSVSNEKAGKEETTTSIPSPSTAPVGLFHSNSNTNSGSGANFALRTIVCNSVFA